jgi:hypothetical protein
MLGSFLPTFLIIFIFDGISFLNHDKYSCINAVMLSGRPVKYKVALCAKASFVFLRSNCPRRAAVLP